MGKKYPGPDGYFKRTRQVGRLTNRPYRIDFRFIRRLVFVDEMGANTSLSPLYAYSPVGQRAHCSVPRNHGKNTTLLSSMSTRGMGPSLAVDGPTDREVFEFYVEKVLVPTLRAGQVMVMDNLSAHKGEKVSELIEARGCELLYLPPYSPDLNPIEEAFSKVKGVLRKVEARTRDALSGRGDGSGTFCGQCTRCPGLHDVLPAVEVRWEVAGHDRQPKLVEARVSLGAGTGLARRATGPALHFDVTERISQCKAPLVGGW